MIQKRSDRPSPWVARVRGPDGRELSKSFKRKLDAQRWHDMQLTEMRAGEWVDPQLGEISVKEWLDRVELGKVDIAESTRRKRRTLIDCHIAPVWGSVSLAGVKPERIQTWIADLSEQLAPSTVHQIVAVFGEGLRRAVAYGRIRSDPTEPVRLPKIPPAEHRYLTRDEADLLAHTLGEWGILVHIGTLSGLRPGEMLGLKWRDVDLEDRNIRVTGDHLKNRQSRRTVSIGTDLTEALKMHRSSHPSVSYVVHKDGHQVDPRWFRFRRWQPAVQSSVGLPCRLHDMRHTHVAWLIEAGAHARAIADRIGHQSIGVTMDVYGGLMDGVRKDLGWMLDRDVYTDTKNVPASRKRPGTGQT